MFSVKALDCHAASSGFVHHHWQLVAHPDSDQWLPIFPRAKRRSSQICGSLRPDQICGSLRPYSPWSVMDCCDNIFFFSFRILQYKPFVFFLRNKYFFIIIFFFKKYEFYYVVMVKLEQLSVIICVAYFILSYVK